MALHRGSLLRDVEVSLSVGYLIVWMLALAELIALPLGILPAGTVTLVIPGVLAIIALAVVLTEEVRISTGIIGTLAILTLLVAAWSSYGFFVSDTRLFWGALLTLMATVPLAIAIIGLECWRNVLSRPASLER